MPNKNDKAFFQLVLDNLPMRVFIKDRSSRYLAVNQLFLSDTGFSDVTDVIGQTDFDLPWTKQQTEEFIRDDKAVMSAGKKLVNIEENQTRGDGTEAWLKTNKIPLFDDKQECIGLLGTYEDITNEITYRKRVEKEALVDDLTKIPNRRFLQVKFEEKISASAAILFIDLDHFKVINDSLGHEVGDLLLIQVAKRLELICQEQAECFKTINVVRLGGDEFCAYIVANHAGQIIDDAKHLAAKFLNSISEVFELGDHRLNIGASIGITLVDGSQLDHAEYFKQADIAMFDAKANQRNSFRFYDKRLQEAADRKQQIHAYLHHAIARSELSLVYQPQYDHRDRLIGCEALARWQNQALGFVSPAEFIKIAEDTGTIHPIGDWIIDTALDDFLDMLNTGIVHADFKLAINVSKDQIFHRSFMKKLKKALNERDIDPKYIQLEITESLFIEDADIAIKVMFECKVLGMTIALDDFGTGFSSLSYLVNLPIDKLKIDKSFVTDIDCVDKNKTLVASIIGLAHGLGMDVIAEGVENARERDELIGIECLQFQGYFYSRPLPLTELIKLQSD